MPKYFQSAYFRLESSAEHHKMSHMNTIAFSSKERKLLAYLDLHGTGDAPTIQAAIGVTQTELAETAAGLMDYGLIDATHLRFFETSRGRAGHIHTVTLTARGRGVTSQF